MQDNKVQNNDKNVCGEAMQAVRKETDGERFERKFLRENGSI